MRLRYRAGKVLRRAAAVAPQNIDQPVFAKCLTVAAFRFDDASL
ncbi:MAG TPA: hypothetical protein VKB88_37135 [Bryobacteraceae bacterium]|nr:hypothetical protein [Bryobacteraceae bacterium]